jgi:hypothetical protein
MPGQNAALSGYRAGVSALSICTAPDCRFQAHFPQLAILCANLSGARRNTHLRHLFFGITRKNRYFTRQGSPSLLEIVNHLFSAPHDQKERAKAGHHALLIVKESVTRSTVFVSPFCYLLKKPGPSATLDCFVDSLGS